MSIDILELNSSIVAWFKGKKIQIVLNCNEWTTVTVQIYMYTIMYVQIEQLDLCINWKLKPIHVVKYTLPP